jgi:hypothetical protein
MSCLFIRFSTEIFNIASYSRTTMSLTTFTQESILQGVRYDAETKCAGFTTLSTESPDAVRLGKLKRMLEVTGPYVITSHSKAVVVA